MKSDTGTETRQRTRRLPFWDNARFLAVTLVIVGHALQRLTYDSPAAYAIYVAIYAFHIPLFLLVSGYFMKSEPPTVRSMLRIFTDILIPYLLLEFVWSLVKWFAKGQFNFDPTRPSWTLWFLLTLAAFKVMLPYLALLRWPLIISVVVSVGSGYLSGVGSTLSIARTLGFLPFFVLGWKISTMNLAETWLTLGRRIWWIRGAALALFALIIAVVYANTDALRSVKATAWLYYKSSYESLGFDSILAGGVRLGLLAVGVLLCAAFLSLVPRRETVFTALGAATMYIYLLHTFVLYPLRESGILTSLNFADPLTVALWITGLSLASVALAFLLASKPVRIVFRPLIQPRTPWLFHRSVTHSATHEETSLPRVSTEIDPIRRDS